jgi:hypothetical protein
MASRASAFAYSNTALGFLPKEIFRAYALPRYVAIREPRVLKPLGDKMRKVNHSRTTGSMNENCAAGNSVPPPTILPSNVG